MNPKLIVYRKGEDQPDVEVELKQFDDTGNPHLYYADVEVSGVHQRVFVDMAPDNDPMHTIQQVAIVSLRGILRQHADMLSAEEFENLATMSDNGLYDLSTRVRNTLVQQLQS